MGFSKMVSPLRAVVMAGVVGMSASEWARCSLPTTPCCNPHTKITQFCPGQIACQECGGGDDCQCPGKVPPVPPPSPVPPPVPPRPHTGMGVCGVAGDVPSHNEAEWGPKFHAASINWYWNWDVKAKDMDYVPEGWYFVPNLWGKGVWPVAPSTTAHHSGPGASTYTISPILLGWNEPDIVGLCVSQPEIKKPEDGWCHTAGSMGWWFPEEVDNSLAMINDWYYQVDNAVKIGYGVTSPMVAVQTGDNWLGPLVRASCQSNRCPEYLVWHFYSYDCSDADEKFTGFKLKMEDSMKLLKEFPTIKGVMITEAGILKLEDKAGVPPAPTCSDDIKVSVMRKMFEIMRSPEYSIGGQSIVKYFSWFSKDGDGATYDLALVDHDTGAMRPLGTEYASLCSEWEASLTANETVLLMV